jgi:hypothetical protein
VCGNDKMSAQAKPAARRVGLAADALSNRAGRLDGRAWRDVERALRLGQKRDVHAVEIHCVRFVLRSAGKPPLETTGGKSAKAMASRRRAEPTSASAAQAKAAPNSAQRRSARRLQKFLEAKAGSGPEKAADQPPRAEPASKVPVRVDSDVRAGDATMEEAEEDRHGRKRGADEASAHAHLQPMPGAAAQHREQRKKPQLADVGGRGRDGPGLKPPPPADRRRERAALALEERREGGRG